MTAETEIEPNDDERAGRKMDDEIRVLSLLIRTLDGLGEPSADRIVRFLHHRYTKPWEKP